jgi:hypothetical protein
MYLYMLHLGFSLAILTNVTQVTVLSLLSNQYAKHAAQSPE